MTACKQSTPSSEGFREWIPVRERLPEQDGQYATLVKPVLGDAFEKVQGYKRQEHSFISGWQFMPVTHWRSA